MPVHPGPQVWPGERLSKAAVLGAAVSRLAAHRRLQRATPLWARHAALRPWVPERQRVLPPWRGRPLPVSRPPKRVARPWARLVGRLWVPSVTLRPWVRVLWPWARPEAAHSAWVSRQQARPPQAHAAERVWVRLAARHPPVLGLRGPFWVRLVAQSGPWPQGRVAVQPWGLRAGRLPKPALAARLLRARALGFWRRSARVLPAMSGALAHA